MEFQLNGSLAAGGFDITRLRGCRLLLKNEAAFPWFILVPEVAAGIEDLHQVDEETYAKVFTAIREVSVFVSDHFQPEKLNVACIGNIVRQMHIHIVARNASDPAWPGTVWAYEGKTKYPDGEAETIIASARELLGE